MIILLLLKVIQHYVIFQWFSPGTLVSSTNITDRHDITEILLKVALNTILLKTIYNILTMHIMANQKLKAKATPNNPVKI